MNVESKANITEPGVSSSPNTPKSRSSRGNSYINDNRTNNNNNNNSSNINQSNTNHSNTTPSDSISTQIQNAFTPITQAFARLSTYATESSTTNNANTPTTINTTSPFKPSSVNSAPFWNRKGKVPGSVKLVSRAERPNGYPRPRSTPVSPVAIPDLHYDISIINSYSNNDSPNSSANNSNNSTANTTPDTTPRQSPPGSPLSPISMLPIPFQMNADDAHVNTNGSLESSQTMRQENEHHCRQYGSCGTTGERATRLSKFNRILKNPIVDLEALRKLSWKGIPSEVRPMTWKLLLGYLPANADRRDATLERKRKEYLDCIPQHFTIDDTHRTEYEKALLWQIYKDVPRTNPDVPLFQQKIMQDILERVLYIWAIRHPTPGYVQGMNDLLTPFLTVFLSEIVGALEISTCELSNISPSSLSLMEADSFWCLSKLLDGIQDHYTSDLPGIQRMTFRLKELIGRIDAPLAKHLEEQGAHFILFALRWMDCMLMRELPLPIVVRMWDTYLAEGPAEGFSVFHVYVCAAFLVMWSAELRQREFQDILVFLQHVPTTKWQCNDIEMLVSQAFLWMSIFQNAPNHFKS
jgi:hypothetical protein